MTCFITQTLLCVLLAALWGLTASAETPQTDSGDHDAAASLGIYDAGSARWKELINGTR